MYKILFLEDNGPLAKNYIDQLQQQGFQVLYSLDAAQSVDIVLNGQLDGMVVDLQLPVPKGVPAHEVGNGDQTGLWFLDKVRARMLELNLPAFVLTNNLAKHRDWLDRFEKQTSPLPAHLLEREQKINCGAKVLPARLRAQIESARLPKSGQAGQAAP